MTARVGLRRHLPLLGAIAAVAFVALTAIPGFAAKPQPEKIFSLVVTPSSAVAGTSTDFLATVTNLTPGNSNINSFSVTAPAQFSNVTASLPFVAASNTNPAATVTVAGNQVNVQFLEPMTTAEFVTVKITATPPSAEPGAECVDYPWSSNAYTGSNLSGSQFRLSNPVGERTTRVCPTFTDSISCEEPSASFEMARDGGVGTTTIGFIDPADCTDVPFTFSYDPDTNTFTIEKDELTVGLAVTVVWPSEVVPGAGEQLQIPPTEVQPPAGFAPVEWCLGTGPSLWEPPEGEDWCIFSQQAVNQGPSGGGQLMQVTDHLVLFGDANGRR